MPAAHFDATYYTENYRDYARQNPIKKLRFYARTVEKHMALGLPRRIHDMGCGFGDFLGTLGEEWEIYGSDVNGFATQQAAKRHPRGVFQVASATDRSVFPVRFGVVTAFDVLEHVPDLAAAAAAVKAQLVPEGWFVFVVPVYDGLSGPVIRRLDRDRTHVHKWPRHQWLAWASIHFETIEWVGLVRYLLGSFYYIHWVTRWLRSHTPAILVVCRRRRNGGGPEPPTRPNSI